MPLILLLLLLLLLHGDDERFLVVVKRDGVMPFCRCDGFVDAEVCLEIGDCWFVVGEGLGASATVGGEIEVEVVVSRKNSWSRHFGENLVVRGRCDEVKWDVDAEEDVVRRGGEVYILPLRSGVSELLLCVRIQ